MQFYFRLQYKRINRIVREAGIHPLPGFLIILLIGVIASIKIFQELPHPDWIYPGFALSILSVFGGRERNNFLQITLKKADYRKIRIIENTLLAFPFVVFCIIQGEYLSGLAILILGAAISLFNQVSSFDFVLPTPFSKRPFEFTSGFRASFWLFLLAYFFSYQSIRVGNFNLGIFSLCLPFLTILSFYVKPEPLFYVWVHAQNPRAFLTKKLKTAFLFSFLVSLPILLSLLFFFPERGFLLFAFELLGFLFVFSALLGKYAYYPSELNLIASLALGLCFLVPPVLLVILPFFFIRAKQNLQFILK